MFLCTWQSTKFVFHRIIYLSKQGRTLCMQTAEDRGSWLLSIFWVDWLAVFCGRQVEQGTGHAGKGQNWNLPIAGHSTAKKGVHMRRKQLALNSTDQGNRRKVWTDSPTICWDRLFLLSVVKLILP